MFFQARLKITGWYILLSMIISLMFSIVVYQALVTEVARFDELQRVRVEERLRAAGYTLPIQLQQRRAMHDAELMEETRLHIVGVLAVINIGILIIVAGVGYMMAGKTLDPIQQMIIEQNRFISDASHELKTPLTSLQSGIEVFLRGKKQTIAQARVLLGENLIDVKRLHELTRSLLDLAQAPSSIRMEKRANILMSTIVQKSLLMMRRALSEKKIVVKKNIDDISFRAHEEDLIQLMNILLDNAIKYSPPKSTVTLSVYKKRRNVHVSVSDEGIGIKSTDLPHVFERFYRADNARSRVGEDGGYGLGLAIAKRIVSHYGGTIAAVKQEKGARFEVVLPA